MRFLFVMAMAILFRPELGLSQVKPTIEMQNSGTKARLIAVSAVDDKVVWLSGTKGTFVRTTDGGSTWQAGVVPGGEWLQFRDVHAFSANEAVLLAIGQADSSRIYSTTDGGKTWRLVFTNDNPKAFFDCFDFQEKVGVAVSDAVDGKFPLIRTEDGGATWKPFQPVGYESIRAKEGEGAFAASGTCLVMPDKKSIWVATAVGGRIIRFGADSAEVFEPPIIRGPSAGIASIAFESDIVGIAAGGDLGRPNDYTKNVIYTEDGGRSWKVGGQPTFAGAVFGIGYVKSFAGVVVAVGPRGASWSVDGGRSWLPLDGKDYWGIGFATNGIGWIVGSEGRVAKLTFKK